MSKINWTIKRKLTGAGSGIVGTLVGRLIEIESLLSFAIIMDNPLLLTVLEIITPIIIGLLFLGAYWIYLKTSDWIKLQLGRIEKLETITDKSLENEKKLNKIENSLLVQNNVNLKIIESISESNDIRLKNLLIQYDETHIQFIIDKNNKNLTVPQANKILNQFRTPIERFHEPN